MVMKATLLSNWKSLTIEKYDGTSDLDEHLGVCIMQVSLYTTDMLCCAKSSLLPWRAKLSIGSLVCLQKQLILSKP